jgi:Transglycosylase
MQRAPVRSAARSTPADVVPHALLGRLSRRSVLIAAGVALGLLLICAASFGPIVRSRIAKEASRRHLHVEVTSVRPGFFAVSLHGVDVTADGIDGVRLHLDDVRVLLSAGLKPKEIELRGGGVQIDGEPENILEQVRAFRKEGGGGTADPAKKKVSVHGDELTVAWRLPSGGDVVATGIEVTRDDDTHVVMKRIAASRQGASLEILGADLVLGVENEPKTVHADAVTLTQAAAPKTAAASTSSAAVEFAPPPLPAQIASTKRGPAPKVVKPPTPKPTTPAADVSDEPVLPHPAFPAARAPVAAIADALGKRIPDGAKIEIGGLSVKLDIDGEAVAFGPGPLVIERRGDLARVVFATDPSAGGTPLALDAELPLAQGDVSARLSGGPVSLAVLGVKEGTKGLFDVGRGTVSGKGQLVLSAAGDALTFDGELGLRSLSIKQPRFSQEPLRNVDLTLSARGVADDAGHLRLDDAELGLGALRVRAHGTLEETKEHFAVALNADIAPAACQALLDGAPEGLLPLVRQARMTGIFGATARMAFDTKTIDKLVLDYQIDDRCKMTEVPSELSREHFESAFTYTAYHPDGDTFDIRTGPGTEDWTELDAISPYMVVAVLTTEDGAFYKHHGFNHAAIRNSVAANLKAKRFLRGASTITMQLAKNVFLTRDKTLSRKIEEVVLTDYLEQIFRKDDMMELYLNLIEFGPDVYGITQAADYYFGRKPDELNLSECLFLATLLPSPVRSSKIRDKGELPDAFAKHIATLIEIAVKNQKVSRAEADEALAQKVVFYKPGDPKPEPRKAVAPRRRNNPEDDTGWQPLD